MQKITVASINKKEGTNDRGPWTLVIIKDDSGSEFTSFDKKLLELTQGAIIDIEVEMRKGKANIKLWNLISEGSPQDSAPGGSQMSKDEWAEKDARERISIERQNACTNVCNLIISGKIGIGDELGQKVMNYLSSKLDGKASAPPASTTSPAPDNSPIKDVGDLLTRCARIKIVKTKLLALVGVADVSEITDLQMAWSKAQADAQFNLL